MSVSGGRVGVVGVSASAGCLPRWRGERIGDLVRSPQYADGPFSTQRTKLEPNSSGCKLALQEWRCHHPRDASQEWRCHHPRDTKTAHCGNLNGRRSAVRKWMQHTGNKDINLIICPGRVAYAPCAMPCYASRTTQHGPGAHQRVPAGPCRNALSTLPKIHGPSRPLLCRADATQWKRIPIQKHPRDARAQRPKIWERFPVT